MSTSRHTARWGPLGGGPAPILRGPRVTLRPPSPGDAEAARSIGVHPEIARLFGEEAAAEWRELTGAEAGDLLAALGPAPDRVSWVVDAGSGFVGTAALHSFDEVAGTAAYAVGLLMPDVLGRGLGTEVTRLVLAFAFDELGLQALTVRVLEFNTRAIRCYTGCGFSHLRREPGAVVIDDVPHADLILRLDSYRYGELAPGWADALEPPRA